MKSNQILMTSELSPVDWTIWIYKGPDESLTVSFKDVQLAYDFGTKFLWRSAVPTPVTPCPDYYTDEPNPEGIMCRHAIVWRSTLDDVIRKCTNTSYSANIGGAPNFQIFIYNSVAREITGALNVKPHVALLMKGYL
jgi:hypothetical protein